MKSKAFKHLRHPWPLVCAIASSYADTVFVSGNLNTTSRPTAHTTGASTAGTSVQYYNVFPFTVSASGSLCLEMASMNSIGARATRWILLSPFLPTLSIRQLLGGHPAGSLMTTSQVGGPFCRDRTPPMASPWPPLASRVRPRVRGSPSASSGPSISSMPRASARRLFVGTASTAQATGTYYLGATGPGIITGIPEPTTIALLGLAAVALGLRAWRNRKAV